MLRALFAALFLLCANAAWSAPYPSISNDVGVCDPNAPSHCIAPDASGNVPITGTITASLGGFTPSASGARMTPLSVTTADSSGNLPTGAVTVVSNNGSNPMYCNVNGVAATTSDQLIASNSWFAFTIPAAVTTLHCIATGGTTTANGVGGAGLPTGAGGGSGGGGGSVTQGTVPWLGSPANQSSTGTGWTSATSGNTTQVLMAVGQGSPSLLVQLNQTSTISGGAVTFEGTYDNTNWVTIPVAQVVNPNTYAPLTNPYTLVQSTNQPFLILTQGYQSVRLKLSTVITGSATVTPQITLLPYNPTISALLYPLAAGGAVIGKVGIDQTTPGTTNGVAVIAGPSGGWTMKHFVAANSDNATNLKASAGVVHAVEVYGINAAPAYLKFYNKASSPTCGSDAVVKQIMIPAASTAANGAGSNAIVLDAQFTTGISYCVVTGIADTDDTSTAAANFVINIDWN